MIGVNIFKLGLFIFVLFLRPATEGHGQVLPLVPLTPFIPRPLCNYQMALANQACLYLPFTQVPPQAPRAPLGPPSPESDDERHEHRHGHGHGHGHGHRHGHEHHDDDDNENEQDHDHDHDGDHNHGRGHRQRRHRRHRRHNSTPMQDECCKWLSQVDDQCVCDLLVRLPPFLTRPVHRYSVTVGGSCNITYACGSRFRV